MKNIFFLAIICVLIISCNDNAAMRTGSTHADSISKNVSSRDRSITPENSYSDLFFDSAMLEKYFNEKRVADSIASRIRSFYNTRNYEYAWFTSDGLTEQARGF